MIKKLFFFIILINILSCNGTATDQSADTSIDNSAKKGNSQLSEPIGLSEITTLVPELQSYLLQMGKSLSLPKLVQLMDDKAYDSQAKVFAQNIALADPIFTRDLFHRQSKEPLHSEITSVRQLSDQEVRKYKINAPAIECYKVEMYNYFYNMTIVAIVNLKNQRVLGVNHLPASAPECSQRTERLAKQVAINYSDIAKELNTEAGKLPQGYTVSVQDSKCERSRHYCLAVIFEKENKKLWTIVDVNDWHVVGWQWIIDEVKERPVVVTERSIQNEFVMDAYCNKNIEFKKGKWDIVYTLTSSDGLEIKNVRFEHKEVINSAKLVDWHVSYTFNNGFGYSDAIGCPMFSSAAVVAFSGATVENLKKDGGFAIVQDFRSPVWPLTCNYRYQYRYELDLYGRFSIASVNH